MTEEGELDQNETGGYTEDKDTQGETPDGDVPKAPKKSSSRGKEESNVGNKYDPKDLASAISTMLKK
jgi:hypothetical protein